MHRSAINKVIKALELEIATSWASEQQLSNLIITGDIQLQMTSKKTLWKAYKILYISSNITIA
jgi:hypothetical protein